MLTLQNRSRGENNYNKYANVPNESLHFSDAWRHWRVYVRVLVCLFVCVSVCVCACVSISAWLIRHSTESQSVPVYLSRLNAGGREGSHWAVVVSALVPWRDWTSTSGSSERRPEVAIVTGQTAESITKEDSTVLRPPPSVIRCVRSYATPCGLASPAQKRIMLPSALMFKI